MVKSSNKKLNNLNPSIAFVVPSREFCESRHLSFTSRVHIEKRNLFKASQKWSLMNEEEKTLYYGIILACIIGIATTSVLLVKTKPPQEEFSELYFYFERIDLIEGEGAFQGCTVDVSHMIWIDLNKDGFADNEETFLAGDTFVLEDEFWNISDVAKDGSQILFGKFPKYVYTGTINFSFVIVNHLSEDHVYEYTIAFNETAKTGSISVKKEEKKVVFQSIYIDTEGEHKVSITIDTGEEVYFYLYVK